MPNWILGEKFNTVYPHKGSVKILWETKWKIACQRSVYPFHDGVFEDFEPIFQKLISDNTNDAYTDAYTNAFIPTAEALEKKGSESLSLGQEDRASDFFRRAAVVYRISRFPYVDPEQKDSIKRVAFDRQKQVYLKAASLWKPIIQEVVIPHVHKAGRDSGEIPLYIRIPEDAGPNKKVPVVLLMTGLDGYRPDNTQRTEQILQRGWATVICEIPGTADCPVDPSDPQSPDRLWSSVLDYMKSRSEFDMAKVAVWGLSAGGFYAIRIACTHRDRLMGAVAHGAGSHFFLDPEWLSKVNDHEYPFMLTPAWAKKYGYDNPADFEKHAQKKFSLVETGVLNQPNCRLLLLNGVDDGVTPIEDSMILLSYGSPKEGRFYPKLPHMGYPDSLGAAYEWLEGLLGKK